jgi:hypothetical protein
MNIDWIIEKFLDNEALLEEGKATVLAVVNELEGEGVTVSAGVVTNAQTITRHVLGCSAHESMPEAAWTPRSEGDPPHVSISLWLMATDYPSDTHDHAIAGAQRDRLSEFIAQAEATALALPATLNSM